MDKKRLQEALLKKEDLILSFKKRGISQIIIENTVNDLERRRLRYLNNEGTDGLYESDEKWLNLLLDEKMISLNGFRFQIFPMDYQEIEREGFDYLPMSNVTKEKFPSNLMCLNVHIPDGVDLGRHQIFDEARTFYKIHYPEYDFHYFVIRSWLVYPGMKKSCKKIQESFSSWNYLKLKKCLIQIRFKDALESLEQRIWMRSI